jgi:hypothetical protein
LQKKRRLNHLIKKDLCSSTSMRRIAMNYGISRTTVVRKLNFLAAAAKLKQKKWLNEKAEKFKTLVFDDLETFEGTKYKPLTVSMVVEDKTRKIVGFRVSTISAKGHLSAVSKKRYGPRRNTSSINRKKLFEQLKSSCAEKCVFKTDMHKDYPKLIRDHFPDAEHQMFRSVRGSLSAQGELKRVGFDPLFSVNHVFAMMRDNIKRLARRTWCNSKKMEFLEKHISIYVDFHNSVLT